MAAINLPAMKTNPKFIFFTDFDGTITSTDSNDYMTDNIGFGAERRKQYNKDVLDGKATFRECFTGMMESITTPYNECIDLLIKHIKIDPGFKEFFQWSLKNNMPVVVLSSGMSPIIEALLRHFIGPDSDKLQVIANNVKAKPGKSINDHDGWEPVFHDNSDFGHDKSLTLRPYAQLPEEDRPTMFYAGDGVSDLSAAKETDLLFAKDDCDLAKYCVRENVPFTTFKDWRSITATVKKIVAGEQSVKDAATKGYELYKKDHPTVNGEIR